MSPRAAITAVFFVNGALVATWASRIPALSDRVHAGPGALSLALLAPAVGALLTMPWVGRQLTRRPSARLTRLSLLASVPAVILPGLAPGLATLALALGLLGCANSALDVSMNAQGVSVERSLGRPILSSLHAAFSGGGLVGAGLGALAAALGLAPALHFLLAAALFGSVGLVAVRWLIPDPAEETPAPAAADPRRMRIPRRLLVLGLLCFCSLLAEGGASDWSAKLMSSELGTSAAVGALTYAGFSAAMTLGRLADDRLFTRWGGVGLLRRSGLLAALGVGIGLALGSALSVSLGFLALGLGLAGVVPTLFRAGADQPGVATGPALATVSSIGYTGFLVGPPLIGAVAGLSSLRLACGLLALAGAIIAAGAASARTPTGPRSDAATPAPELTLPRS